MCMKSTSHTFDKAETPFSRQSWFSEDMDSELKRNYIRVDGKKMKAKGLKLPVLVTVSV